MGDFPPPEDLCPEFLIFSAAYCSAFFWPAAGLLLLVKLPVIGLAIILAYYLSGEFNAREIALAVSLLPSRRPGNENGGGT